LHVGYIGRTASTIDVAQAFQHQAAALELWGLRVDPKRRIIATGNVEVRRYCAQRVGPIESWHPRRDPD
jgi:hypothetical protein